VEREREKGEKVTVATKKDGKLIFWQLWT
jgi:hypothetical protein